MDDAVHPLVLQDDHSVLRERGHFPRSDRLRGGEMVFTEAAHADVQIQQSLVLEQLGRAQRYRQVAGKYLWI